MKNIARIFCAVAAIVTAPAMAVTVSINPAAQIDTLGTSLAVDVLISDLGDFSSLSLGSFDIFVSYDTSILSPTAAAYSSQLNGGDPGSSIQFGLPLESGPNTSGTCPVATCFEIGEISLLADQDLLDNQPASFVVATVSFDSLSVGTSLLSLQFTEFFDELGVEITGVVLQNGSVTVEAAAVQVPLPATLLLFGTALFWRRRSS